MEEYRFEDFGRQGGEGGAVRSHIRSDVEGQEHRRFVTLTGRG